MLTSRSERLVGAPFLESKWCNFESASSTFHQFSILPFGDAGVGSRRWLVSLQQILKNTATFPSDGRSSGGGGGDDIARDDLAGHDEYFFSFFYVSNSRAKMRSYRLSRDEASNDALHVGGCAIYISENLGGKGSQQQRRNVTNPNELAKNAQSGPPNLATTRTRIYTEKFRNLELYIAN